MASFTAAAEDGCYICKPLLRYALGKCGGNAASCVAKPYTYRVYQYKEHAMAQLLIDMEMDRGGQIFSACRGFWAVPQPALHASLGIGTRKLGPPLEEATAAASAWINGCMDGHEQCRKNTQPSWYPSRLLQLEESTVRLIIPAETSPSGPYAALSYCWGPRPDFIQLKASNMTELTRGIPQLDLPVAFQEAILLLRALSIKYLWIDSLCIIQSGPRSTEEWQYESSKMESVYSNSVLTLALSRSVSPGQSLLDACPAAVTRPFEVEATGIITGDPRESHTCTVVSQNYFREGLYDLPLGSRAWALQERLLSPRVLSFGLGELFWECVQLPEASESLPRGLVGLDASSLPSCLSLLDKSIPGGLDDKELDQLWWRIVEDYSDRELTFPARDKLVALSAVASWMSGVMGDVYIAGHFWRSLPFSLNWQIEPPLARRKRRDRQSRRIVVRDDTRNSERRRGAPSWSWPSMDGPLFSYQGRYWECLAEAVSYSLVPADATRPTGEIDSAILRVRARCGAIEWKEGKPLVLDGAGQWDHERHDISVNIDDPRDEPAEGDKFVIMALAVDTGLRALEGLVLRSGQAELGTDTDGSALYERIGHFRLESDTQREDMAFVFQREERTIALS